MERDPAARCESLGIVSQHLEDQNGSKHTDLWNYKLVLRLTTQGLDVITRVAHGSPGRLHAGDVFVSSQLLMYLRA